MPSASAINFMHAQIWLPPLVVPPAIRAILEECLDLEDLIDRLTWADAVTASGYLAPEPVTVFSGFIAPDESLPAPSGYIKKANGKNLWDF